MTEFLCQTRRGQLTRGKTQKPTIASTKDIQKQSGAKTPQMLSVEMCLWECASRKHAWGSGVEPACRFVSWGWCDG
jgi:hypothetical protein